MKQNLQPLSVWLWGPPVTKHKVQICFLFPWFHALPPVVFKWGSYLLPLHIIELALCIMYPEPATLSSLALTRTEKERFIRTTFISFKHCCYSSVKFCALWTNLSYCLCMEALASSACKNKITTERERIFYNSHITGVYPAGNSVILCTKKAYDNTCMNRSNRCMMQVHFFNYVSFHSWKMAYVYMDK